MLSDRLNAKRAAPDGYEKYVTDLTTSATFYLTSFANEAEITKLTTTVTIPQTAYTALKTALSSKNGNFQILEGNAYPANNKLEEFIGSYYYDTDGKLYLLLFTAVSTGSLLQQTQIRTEHHCKRKFLHHKHCWDEEYEENRDFTADELNLVKNVLFSKSILGLRSKFYEENEKLQKEVTVEKEKQAAEQAKKDPVQEAINAKRDVFISNLKRLANTGRTKPAGYETLVRNIVAYTDVNMDMFDKNEVDAICAKYSLPEQVKKDLKAIVFVSDAISSGDIKYLNNLKTASVEEILGFVMKEQNAVFFAFIRSVTEGEIPRRTKNVDVKLCHHTLIGKSCHHESRVVEDPYTPAELEIVKNAILAINAEKLNNKLATINESQILLGTGKIISPDGKIAAILNNDGRLIIGPAANPLSGTLHTIGTAQTTAFAPYSLEVKENGNLYIVNKNNDKVWSSNTPNMGTKPFKLVLEISGELKLIDSTGKIISAGKYIMG